MDEETAWTIYFAGIASLRFHPSNHLVKPEAAVEYAAKVADLMLSEHRERFPCLGS